MANDSRNININYDVRQGTVLNKYFIIKSIEYQR
jgi:hypothetical protein